MTLYRTRGPHEVRKANCLPIRQTRHRYVQEPVLRFSSSSDSYYDNHHPSMIYGTRTAKNVGLKVMLEQVKYQERYSLTS